MHEPASGPCCRRGWHVSHPDLIVVILAAGASRRLGRAKQMVTIGGVPLLRRQCLCAFGADVGPVVVILGSGIDRHRAAIADLPVDVRINDEWTEGLASSLRCAARVGQERHAALLILPCDQYRIVPGDLRALADGWRLAPLTPHASRWDDYAGPPAILPVEYHQQLLELRGDVGARVLLRNPHRYPVEVVNPRAAFDLDTPADVTAAEAWMTASG
jgi:CTP:molybdopterin cytidylyltransferase MocA